MGYQAVLHRDPWPPGFMGVLTELLDIPEWQELAQCQGTNSSIFFNDLLGRPGGRKAELESIAKSICKVCIVREDCLDYAIDTRQASGIWGGHTTRERVGIARRRRREDT